MSRRDTEALIAELAAEARPVDPLAPPLRRAGLTLALLLGAGAVLAWLWGDSGGLHERYAGREAQMWLEMAAMLATALTAVAAAFALSVPGAVRGWRYLPALPLAAWIALAGLGCVGDLERLGPAGFAAGHGGDCLIFILIAGTAVGAPLLWRLSRARPIEPLPVALLGALGAAALAALLLQFFHPFAVTLIDFGLHFGAVLILLGMAAAGRRLLRPA